jgi:hypothetical protein
MNTDKFQIGFIEHLLTVTTIYYSTIVNSHSLQFITVCTKSTRSAVSLYIYIYIHTHIHLVTFKNH